MTLRDEIRDYAQRTPPAPLPVPTPDLPRHDGKIFVRRVASGVIHAYIRKLDDDADPRAATVAILACDESGNRIFNDDDVLWLSTAAALGPTIERLYVAGCFWNGLDESNRSAFRKNLPSMEPSGSPCCSAEPSTPAADSTTDDS